jgi:heme exporter protein D
MAEFFAMGGYAAFVWSAFGVTAVVIVVNIVSARRRMRSVWQQLVLRAARNSQRRPSQ